MGRVDLDEDKLDLSIKKTTPTSTAFNPFTLKLELDSDSDSLPDPDIIFPKNNNTPIPTTTNTNTNSNSKSIGSASAKGNASNSTSNSTSNVNMKSGWPVGGSKGKGTSLFGNYTKSTSGPSAVPSAVTVNSKSSKSNKIIPQLDDELSSPKTLKEESSKSSGSISYAPKPQLSKQSSFLVSENAITSPVSAQWYWQSDLKWEKYDKVINTLIEGAYKENAKVVNIDDARLINFEYMEQQRRDDPSRRRSVQREEIKSVKDEVVISGNSNDAEWFWQSEGGWEPYSRNLSSSIEKAFINKSPRKVYIDKVHYVDLFDMVQKRKDEPAKIRYILRNIAEKQRKTIESTLPPDVMDRIQKSRQEALKKRALAVAKKKAAAESKDNFQKTSAKKPMEISETKPLIPPKNAIIIKPKIAPSNMKKGFKEEDSEATEEMDSEEQRKRRKIPSTSIVVEESSEDTQQMDEDTINISFTKDKEDNDISHPVEDTEKLLAIRRAKYKCGNRYVQLKDVPKWSKTLETLDIKGDGDTSYSISPELNKRVSLWQGDITCIEIDAIVNAAKATLLGGGGIDGAIHKAAGAGLLQECSLIGGCDPGDSRITGGYKLPARHVIHTVGPIGENKGVLEKCYLSVLRKAVKRNIQTLAFCCISTGIFGYPNEPAAHVALETVRKWLEHKQNYTKIKRIIFCVFLKTDLEIYSRLMKNVYFPG
eukprot:TRINITY_DN10708_c0_g2_i1.p1 TRINITY_DN10708_c0_g2~~TRINITY_DN10708_c0_g2_i1.p1  ORF type:complete len:724 (-),score=227.18 TRINITY_DN10708_c0_g2_i1:33-2153(-)